jgi:hypothetical protein
MIVHGFIEFISKIHAIEELLLHQNLSFLRYLGAPELLHLFQPTPTSSARHDGPFVIYRIL